jgi:L-ribulose-5-phosphate 4-epimerase
MVDIASPPGVGTLRPLKQRVAACCRLLHMERVLNYSGHVSARVPGRDALLIHPLMESRATVSADSILMCDLDCALLPESPPGRPPSETFIHSEIYRARPEVQAIAHTHSELAAAFTMAETLLAPMKSHAVRWASGIPIHPDPSHIKTARQGRELAATLGPHNAALLRAHGGVVVAESLEALLVDAVHFEENARAQLQALAIGRPLPLTAEELELLRSRSNRDSHVVKLWRYYVGRGLSAGVLDSDEGLL